MLLGSFLPCEAESRWKILVEELNVRDVVFELFVDRAQDRLRTNLQLMNAEMRGKAAAQIAIAEAALLLRADWRGGRVGPKVGGQVAYEGADGAKALSAEGVL